MKGIVYDVQLTSYAHGIAPDYSSMLAELMAPQCVAPAAAGHYIKFDDDDAFRYIETRRALGGDMAMIDFPTSSPKFSCDPHALGIPTDKFEYERVGEAGLTMLRESKIRTLVSRNALSREQRVFKAYADGTTAEVGLGDWTDKDVDPIAELNSIVVALATETGRADVHIVIGLNALEQAAKHPKVLARMPGAELASLTAEKLGKMLLIATTIHVAMIPIVLEKVGKAGNKGIIAGSKVYALISQENPSPFDPSAAKTFTTKKGQVDGVGFVDKPPFGEVNFMAWSEDIQLTGTKCVKRIDVTTGAIA
ncbi:hypothetical protein BH09VER1_BH09VER1_24600 [soil metagenome]